MTAIKVTIFGVGPGQCSLTDKECSDGLTVSFDDGTVKEAFLSTKAFLQLVRMKAGPEKKPRAAAGVGAATGQP